MHYFILSSSFWAKINKRVELNIVQSGQLIFIMLLKTEAGFY